MAETYEKQTIDTVDFPLYTLGFLASIMQKLKFYGWVGNKPAPNVQVPTSIMLPLVSKKYPYCHDAIELIRKTLRNRGVECIMSSYKLVVEKDGKKAYRYEFQLTKK